jgi:uncharacterized sulfatase
MNVSKVALIGALAIAMCWCGGAQDAAAAQPNVLLIISDDLAARLGCYGDPLVTSPNIDRLAARGVRFDRAYCQFPLCNPSRASFLTGLRPDTLKVYENATQFRKNVPDAQSLGQTFQKAGYYVARVGKLYHYGVPAQIGTDGLDDPPSWAERYNPKGSDVEEQAPLVKRVELDAKTGKAVLTTGNPLNKTGATLSWLEAEGPDSGQTDGKIADRAIELLEAHKGGPFFLAVGFFRPHTPYVAPKKYFEGYPSERIVLPTVPANYRSTVPKFAFTFRKEEEAMDDAQRRMAIRAYHAATSFMDAQAGRVMDALERLKLTDNTVVVFMSDHGYQLYEHQLWQKMTLFENTARVPLIIAAPGGGAKGAVSKRVVELVDLHATLAELCGLPIPAKLDGVSLKPLVENPAAAWDRPAITQVTRGGGAGGAKRIMGYTIRDEDWRYTQWDGGKAGAELYDHEADPTEVKNLANDPGHAAVVAAMKRALVGVIGAR